MNEYGSIDERPLRLQTVEGNDKYSAKQRNIHSLSVGCFQAPVSPLSPG